MKVLPVDFENRMKNLLGDEFEDYRNSLEEEPVKSFRVNTDKISLFRDCLLFYHQPDHLIYRSYAW